MSRFEYACQQCGMTGVKLWREAHAYSGPLVLLCVDCCGKHEGIDPATVDEVGDRVRDDGWLTDQIGWWVPAVPDWDGEGMWGYTSSPPDDYERWRKMPIRLIKFNQPQL